MRFGATANSLEIKAMGRVVDRYCEHMGINRGTPEAEQIASLVLALHEVGIRGETELLQALIVPKGRLPNGRFIIAARAHKKEPGAFGEAWRS